MTLYKRNKINTKTKLAFVFVFFFFLVFNIPTLSAQSKTYSIVLDAGHGGRHPGKVVLSKNYYEKVIALNIVLEVGKILEKQKNIEVIYTRKKDVFLGLKERGEIANKADADLFVSIHCNSHTSQASGIETYVLGLHVNKQNLEVAKQENEMILLEDNYEEKYKGYDPSSPASIIGITLMQEEYLDQSLALASIVQKNMVTDIKGKDRGVKQAGFMVLHQTYMPSILIETGFISNSKEGSFLNSKNGQNKYATSIANGISEYIKQVNYNSVSNDQVTEVIVENGRIIKDVIFKVQISSGRNKLETKSYNFKGLKGVERVKVGKSYKYYLGKTSDFNEIKDHHLLAKKKGFTTAFVVAFKDGVKISVAEALKSHQ